MFYFNDSKGVFPYTKWKRFSGIFIILGSISPHLFVSKLLMLIHDNLWTHTTHTIVMPKEPLQRHLEQKHRSADTLFGCNIVQIPKRSVWTCFQDHRKNYGLLFVLIEIGSNSFLIVFFAQNASIFLDFLFLWHIICYITSNCECHLV